MSIKNAEVTQCDIHFCLVMLLTYSCQSNGCGFHTCSAHLPLMKHGCLVLMMIMQ